MFTGIIKEIGKVSSIVKKGTITELGVISEIIYPDSKVSDSISLNGVCLTLIYKQKKSLFFEVVKSTLENTNLKRLKVGDFVNLEPSLKFQDKVGGHFVLGHVDGEARLRRVVSLKSYWQFEIELPSAFKRFILEKGSIAIEGISLTIKKVFNRYFTVDIIPFTYQHTNLKYKRAGDWLNIEYDYLLKAIKDRGYL
jgi:riboflavin synthase